MERCLAALCCTAAPSSLALRAGDRRSCHLNYYWNHMSNVRMAENREWPADIEDDLVAAAVDNLQLRDIRPADGTVADRDHLSSFVFGLHFEMGCCPHDLPAIFPQLYR